LRVGDGGAIARHELINQQPGVALCRGKKKQGQCRQGCRYQLLKQVVGVESLDVDAKDSLSMIRGREQAAKPRGSGGSCPPFHGDWLQREEQTPATKKRRIFRGH
jgi:hypothetical protein